MRERTDLQFNYEMSYLKQHRSLKDLPPKEPRFKPRSGKEHALPLALAHELGSLHTVLGGHPRPASGPLGLEGLATVAHYTLGLLRYEPTDLYPLHRGAPSPRCLFASELSYVSLGGGVLPPGVYRYHPARHTLVEQALPDEGFLERCFAGALGGTSGGWLLSSIFGRISFLYGRFSVRLSMLEAGHVIAQLRLMSRALGLATEVRPCFAHPELSRWLGEDEVPLALLTSGTPLAKPEGQPEVAAPPRPWLETGFRQALLRRHSGHGSSGVYPVPEPVSSADVSGLAWYALDELLKDSSAEVLRLGLYMVVMNSQDAKPGVYRWKPRERELEWLRPVTPGQELARTLFTSPGFAARHCPVIAVIAADVRGALKTWGDEGYFRALAQAGQVAQRVGLAAAGRGLFARPAVSLDEAATDRLLGLHLSRETSLYTVVVGKDREHGFPIRLSL